MVDKSKKFYQRRIITKRLSQESVKKCAIGVIPTLVSRPA